MNILSPSILAADFWQLGEQIQKIQEGGAQYLHIDVMDGMFVPSISFGIPVIASLRSRTALFFDVHLMIEEPERYVEEFIESGADMITFHIEATSHISDTIAYIKSRGKKVGLSIRPNTPAKALEPYLDQIDMVLIMTVEPGFGGQKMLPECVQKVTEIRNIVTQRKLCVNIEVDGGITIDNVGELTAAGANVIVAGSAVFKDNITENVQAFLKKMNE